MKKMVTGGAGFIGSAIISYLIRETRDEGVNLDALIYVGNFAESERFRFEHANICDQADVRQIFIEQRSDDTWNRTAFPP
jgi:dTDP-glucose 4,6-dehydratase